MNGVDKEPMAPQTFFYGCVLEPGKEVVFNPEDDDFEHQLDLRMACVDASVKDELQMVEVEGQDAQGQNVKAVLVSLKPSVLPSVCLGGFTISPPAVFRLKSGSGPVYLSGQHLVMMDADEDFDEDDDDIEEEEEEEIVRASKKRPASSPAQSSRNKKKNMEVEEDEDDDDEDMEDDDDDDEDESEAEESPVKPKPAAKGKAKTAAQNGKGAKAKAPAKKQEKSPKGKGEKSPKTPPKTPATLDEAKAKMMESIKKGVSLPKAQPKFENFLKHGQRITDTKMISDLWKWRQALPDTK